MLLKKALFDFSKVRYSIDNQLFIRYDKRSKRHTIFSRNPQTGKGNHCSLSGRKA